MAKLPSFEAMSAAQDIATALGVHVGTDLQPLSGYLDRLLPLAQAARGFARAQAALDKLPPCETHPICDGDHEHNARIRAERLRLDGARVALHDAAIAFAAADSGSEEPR